MNALRLLCVWLMTMLLAPAVRADVLDDLAHDFWVWRASEMPVSTDDIPRLERPLGCIAPAGIGRNGEAAVSVRPEAIDIELSADGHSPFENFNELSGEIAACSVAIVGCGPIGLFAIAVARAVGATQVFALEPNQHRAGLAKKMKADVVIDPTTQDPKQIVLDATNGVGADVVAPAGLIALPPPMAPGVAPAEPPPASAANAMPLLPRRTMVASKAKRCLVCGMCSLL